VRLVRDLPTVLGMLEAGLTTLPAVRAVCSETVNLLAESMPLADEILADDLVDTPPSRARSMARTRVFEIDPGAAQAAALSAREDRFVCVSPSVGVGMGCLSAVLPAEQATACVNGLRAHARARHGAGDPRTISQIMADTLVERVTGQGTADAVPASVGLVMSDLTLLGLDDRPGQLLGYGPIPAGVARWLAPATAPGCAGSIPTASTPPLRSSTRTGAASMAPYATWSWPETKPAEGPAATRPSATSTTPSPSRRPDKAPPRTRAASAAAATRPNTELAQPTSVPRDKHRPSHSPRLSGRSTPAIRTTTRRAQSSVTRPTPGGPRPPDAPGPPCPHQPSASPAPTAALPDNDATNRPISPPPHNPHHDQAAPARCPALIGPGHEGDHLTRLGTR
jgi:hypothetical protein